MSTPLTLRFQTDVSAAQSGLANFAASVVSNMTKASGALALGIQNIDKINLAFQRVSGSAAAIPKIAADVASGIATFIAFKIALDAVAAAGKAAMEALEGTAKVGSDAARLGVGTTFLQSYQAQARNLKVEVDDLTKALETAKAAFTVRQGEGGEGARNQSSFEGRLRQQLAAGNITSQQLNSFLGAQGNEAQFRAALDIMIQLVAKGRELAALDLASRIFPESIVDKIRSGAIELDRFKKGIDDLRNPDLVLLSPEEITRAQELQRRLEEAQATLDNAAKEFSRDLARAGARLAEDAIRWKETVAEGARILLNASRFAAQAGREYSQGAGLSAGGNPSGSAGALGATLGRAAVPRAAQAGEVFGPVDQAREDALNRLRGGLGNQTLQDQARRASVAMSRGVRPDGTNTINTGGTKKAGGASETDPIETFINQLEKSAAALKAEADAFNKSNAEKQVAIQLAKAQEIASQNGKTLTDAQTEAIKKAATETANYKDKIQDLEQAQRQAADAARYFGQMAADSLADAALEGRSFNEVLSNIIKSIARSSLTAIFTGQGPLASILGTAPSASSGDMVGGLAGIVKGAFSGGAGGALQGPTMSGATLDTVAGGGSFWNTIGSFFRANGGPVRAGVPYTVGEMGREMFIPNQNGRIVPIDGGPGGGGGGGTTYIGGDTISITPAGGVSYEQMAAFFAARDQRLQRDLPMITARSQSRFGVPKR